MKRHPLHLADQPMEPVGRKQLEEMPSLRGSQRTPEENKDQVEKDLPE